MISGATGALAVVMVDLVKEGNAMDGNGLTYLFITLLLVGIIQMSAGFSKTRKICSTNTAPSNEGICKWFSHRNFPCSNRHVQRFLSLADLTSQKR